MTERHDVVIAGAGLPGLALAAALARGGLNVALADRAAVDTPATRLVSTASRPDAPRRIARS